MELRTIEVDGISHIGIVRWFSKDQGYGFVTVEEHGDDILLHANVLRDFGVNMALAGSAIEFEWERTERGYRVSKVLSLAQPDLAEKPDKPNLGEHVHGELEPVKVKWYNAKAGYGFVNRFDDPSDIFIGSNVLRLCGRDSLITDEALSVRVHQDEGKERVYELGIW